MSTFAATLTGATGAILLASSMEAKVALVERLLVDWRSGQLADGRDEEIIAATDRVVPSFPVLVDPKDLPSRRLHTKEGQQAAIHAIAHIEANAIDLAIDAAHRFRGFPRQFYDQWLQVAAEEAVHFGLLQQRLHSLGVTYGDFPGHGGLWKACIDTADDPLRRMALVPRVLEARGLDVNPAMSEKFRAIGDGETVAILQRIMDDEVGHVGVGDFWFRWCCHQQNLEPESTFASLLAEAGIRIRPPLNIEARLAAGFSKEEIQRMGH